jgi:hypothetical protein
VNFRAFYDNYGCSGDIFICSFVQLVIELRSYSSVSHSNLYEQSENAGIYPISTRVIVPSSSVRGG